MRFAAITFGTEGDTRPFVALCRALIDSGHEPVLLTDKSGVDLAAAHGVKSIALAGDIKSAIEDMLASSKKSVGRSAMTKALSAVAKSCTAEWMRALLETARNCNAIIAAGPPIYVALSVAEHLRIPLIGTSLQPIGNTREFQSPFFPPRVPQWCNRLTHSFVGHMIWWTCKRSVNQARGQVLNAKPWREPFMQFPVLFAVSSHLVPRPADWPENYFVTGPWKLAEGKWEPSEELRKFLSSGEPPIYVGFGSMVGFDRDRVLKDVLGALDGRRALLSSGWSELGHPELPANIFRIGPAPHDQLFTYVSMVIHHGGAGTSHTVAAAGVPSVVIPFGGDQVFWGARLQWAGVAPEPIPYERLTSNLLRTRIRESSSLEMRNRAIAVGEKMRSERGLETALSHIEQLLNSDVLTKKISDPASALRL